MFPSLGNRYLLLKAVAAKPLWQPSGRGRRRSMGKRTNKLKALKANGEELCKESGNERVSFRVSIRAPEASLGKQRRLTGTMKFEISCKSHFSSVAVEWSIMDFMT
jgi:hypothetical protein